MLGAALDIFSKDGFGFLSRGPTWSSASPGSACSTTSTSCRSRRSPRWRPRPATTRSTSSACRALWWFRWAAVATVVTGLLILAFQDQLDDMTYFKSAPGMAIATGILLGTHDVRERVGGHLAEPEDRDRQRPQRAGRWRGRPARGRRAARRCWPPARTRSSRCRCWSSWSERRTSRTTSSTPPAASAGVYWAITIVVWLAFELNALGVIGGQARWHEHDLRHAQERDLHGARSTRVLMLVLYAVVLS